MKEIEDLRREIQILKSRDDSFTKKLQAEVVKNENLMAVNKSLMIRIKTCENENIRLKRHNTENARTTPDIEKISKKKPNKPKLQIPTVKEKIKNKRKRSTENTEHSTGNYEDYDSDLTDSSIQNGESNIMVTDIQIHSRPKEFESVGSSSRDSIEKSYELSIDSII